MRKKLPLSFYRRSTETVALELLGKTLVHQLPSGVRLSGKIVETEAYLGLSDPACHSYGPRRTPRTEILFNDGGHSYVYFIYGMYFCFNVVTEKKNQPEAVLIRALEPIDGIDLMLSQSKSKKIEQLCNGPGKLCLAMGINKNHSGLLLKGPSLWIEDHKPVDSAEIETCNRIGITQAVARDWPLRFYVKNSRHISKRHTPRM